MGAIQLIVLLFVIGLVVGLANYLFAEYMNAAVLNLINKLAVVACVVLVLLWLLGAVGLAPPIRAW